MNDIRSCGYNCVVPMPLSEVNPAASAILICGFQGVKNAVAQLSNSRHLTEKLCISVSELISPGGCEATQIPRTNARENCLNG